MVDFSSMLLRLPGRDQVSAAVDRMSIARDAVAPFVAGETVSAAVSAVGDAMAEGMSASVEYLPTPDGLGSVRFVHLQTIEALDDDGLAEGNDLIVDPVALGLGGRTPIGTVRADIAALCAAAADRGMTVTLAGVGHEALDDVLATRAALAGEFPDIGVTLAATLLRTESDCLDLAEAGARVRLVKREVTEPVAVAFTRPNEVDKAYVRCMRLLLAGAARTIVATHDARLTEIAAALAQRSEHSSADLTYQFRRGVAPDRAAQLAAGGSAVALLVPFGPDWAGYVSRRIPLRPAALGQAARAAVTGPSAQ